MREEFKRIKKDLPNLRGLILDLRSDPGGLLDQAVSVSDAFLKQGEIVSTRERDPSKTKRYSAHPGDELVDDDIPMVVLVNIGSASASGDCLRRAFAGPQTRAIIMGARPFGKGSVQTVIPLEGHGAMRLTTARYYTPSGRSIQAKGIVPDILVEQAKIEPIKNKEKMRTEADLRKRLENLEDKKAQEKKAQEEKSSLRLIPEYKPAVKDKDKGKEKRRQEKGGLEGDIAEKEDFQLQRALDLLRAVNVYNQTSADK